MRSDRLREIRELRGLSQEDLGQRINTNKQQIYRYETGANVPSADVLARIATELEVSSDYLLGLADSQADHFREDELTPEERALIKTIRAARIDEAVMMFADLINDVRKAL